MISNDMISNDDNQHSDPVAMPTMERILASGVNHWYFHSEHFND